MKHTRFGTIALACLISTTAVGCATVTRGASQTWTVDTTPSGAIASLSNGEQCTTPCTLKLKRKHPFTVELCKAGYQAVVTTVQSGVSGGGATGMAGNVLVGGLIGVGIDAASGATKDLTPNPLAVVLEKAMPGCTMATPPAVPEDGQTPADYAKTRKG